MRFKISTTSIIHILLPPTVHRGLFFNFDFNVKCISHLSDYVISPTSDNVNSYFILFLNGEICVVIHVLHVVKLLKLVDKLDYI